MGAFVEATLVNAPRIENRFTELPFVWRLGETKHLTAEQAEHMRCVPGDFQFKFVDRTTGPEVPKSVLPAEKPKSNHFSPRMKPPKGAPAV